MKKVMIIFIVAVLSVVAAPVSSAHVLVTDTSGKTGAILHIIADDDPIAGEVSSIYFDMQDAVTSKGVRRVAVDIKNHTGDVDSIIMNIDGSLATAKYTFLLQGNYSMTFKVSTQSQEFVYEQEQRVSRGVTSGALNRPTHPWAEAALIGCGALFMVGCILLWNHRKEVWRHSTF